MSDFVQTLVDASALGALFALVAMGIGLVFGVIRLVNFAQGELITAGAYALWLSDGAPVVLRVLSCFAVVMVLAALMDLAYRPLRGTSPATMLVATFAVSFLLQNVALLAFGSRGEAINFLPGLNRAVTIGDVRIRWITILSILLGGALLAGVAALLNRTNIGLQMRAAAADFRTARILGVRANRVIAFAFVLGAFLTAAATLSLAVQRPFVNPTFGFAVVVPALVGVVVGGLDRLLTATLGGFTIGFATTVLADVLPSDQRVFLDSALFALVITVLLVKPDGLFSRRRAAAERV